jgi:hypothetical protein
MCEITFSRTHKNTFIKFASSWPTWQNLMQVVLGLLLIVSHRCLIFYYFIFPTYAFLFFYFFLLLPNFQCQLVSFYSIVIHVFRRLLWPSSLKCPKISLIHWQVFLPISRGEIGLVSIEVITLTSYLKGLLPQSYFCRIVAHFY